ncbi:MAG TPA: hypothetical protein VF773_19105 [Verrucomicrobiae bacterium]
MKKLSAVFTFALTAMFLVGCATTKVDWNSRIGQYTYDEAIAELGVPDRHAQLTDGSIVAEWLQRRGGAYATSFGPRWSHYQSIDLHEMPDSYLRLIFSPDMKLARVGSFAR